MTFPTLAPYGAVLPSPMTTPIGGAPAVPLGPLWATSGKPGLGLAPTRGPHPQFEYKRQT